MSLDNTPTNKLIELSNLLYNENLTINDWKNEFDNENDLRENLIEMLVSDILNKGYDGENNYNSMYWFVKGLNIPSPKPLKRYIDSDDYLFKNLNKYKIQDNIHDFNRQRLHEKFNRDLHKKDSSFLDELMKHSKDIREFWRSDLLYNSPPADALNDEEFFPEEKPKEINLRNIKSFKEWQKLDDEQQTLVDDMMKSLYKTPTNWEINFELLNNKGKKLMFPLLKNFFQEYIDPLPMDKYKIEFKVKGQWHSKPLTPEVYNKLMENFTEEHFIFDLDEIPAEFTGFNSGDNADLPDWSLFSSLRFSKYLHKDRVRKDVGGSFFNYIANDKVPKKVIEYLKRLQIFDSLVDEKVTVLEEAKEFTRSYYDNLTGDLEYETIEIPAKITKSTKQREELNDCCFVYALKQTGYYSDDILNQIRLRINNRYLSQGSIEKICQEFKIHIKLSYIDDSSDRKNKKTTVQQCKNKVRKSYLGVKDAEPQRTHTFNVYEDHYFIEEKTPFSTYYIKHLIECTEDKFDKEYNSDHWRKTRYYISSSNLVRELMKQGYFNPITYGQYRILKTVFYHEFDKDLTNINLEYDPEYCTKLIAPKIVKESENKTDPTYWYADFEADVSGNIHKPFMCVLQSQNGKINECFKGETCNKQFLDFLPDHAVVYFHNLAYDFRMFS